MRKRDTLSLILWFLIYTLTYDETGFVKSLSFHNPFFLTE